eukprot:CAMPEP_0116114782 /NCGR_PEP_ID=MMETSP0329-20121206/158_1 /TAXON_ID=697910 /ORGANISM="Pseudo-nitzschia arenysensis, Strain B593" /LENGTH=55 /DNA_ID=CAMNT_0003608173 /DNA_START=103 /DNA_END=270 /DNA_ORIENTATION=-
MTASALSAIEKVEATSTCHMVELGPLRLEIEEWGGASADIVLVGNQPSRVWRYWQ